MYDALITKMILDNVKETGDLMIEINQVRQSVESLKNDFEFYKATESARQKCKESSGTAKQQTNAASVCGCSLREQIAALVQWISDLGPYITKQHMEYVSTRLRQLQH